MAEIVAIQRWLYGKLSGVSGVSGRVYANVAPINSDFPLILYQMQTGSEIPSFRERRSFGISSEWLVRAVGQTMSLTELESVADQMHAAIERLRDGLVVGCVRTQPFVMTEEIDGLQYHHLGGIYQIWVRE